METQGFEISRGATGVRCLLALLFFVITRVVGTVVLVVVIFELLYTLITTSPPPERVRSFANRALSYIYRVLRYLTYAEPRPPFPFADFPDEIEPLGAPYPADS